MKNKQESRKKKKTADKYNELVNSLKDALSVFFGTLKNGVVVSKKL